MRATSSLGGLALVAAIGLALAAKPAMAADTLVTCNGPVATVNTGQDGTLSRFTLHCSGGSSAGNITFFAYKIAASATNAQMLQQTFSQWLIQNMPGNAISILSNLSDTSGASWGCGASNCRIIDYLTQ